MKDTKKINVLDVLALRKVNFPAHHFTYTHVLTTLPKAQQQLESWIVSHLKGRFYIGTTVDLVDNVITYMTTIGFEDPRELSIFNLAGLK